MAIVFDIYRFEACWRVMHNHTISITQKSKNVNICKKNIDKVRTEYNTIYYLKMKEFI